MVEGIRRAARAMGFTTVAEHVDNEATLLALEQLGTDYVQGNLLGLPAPRDVFVWPKTILFDHTKSSYGSGPALRGDSYMAYTLLSYKPSLRHDAVAPSDTRMSCAA